MALAEKTRYAITDFVVMSGMFVFVQLLGTWFTLKQQARLDASGTEPTMITSSVSQVGGVGIAVGYVLLLLLFTLVILGLIKYDAAGILSYVAYVMIFITFLSGSAIAGIPILFSIAIAATVTVVYHVHRTWYVITGVGLVLSIVTVGAFASVWSTRALFTLLVLLAIYDFVAVYVTGHMQVLARGASDKLPLLVVIPHNRNVSLDSILNESDEESTDGRAGTALGLGDLIIPSTVVPIASTIGTPLITVFGVGITPTFLASMVGTLLGVASLVGLLYYVDSDGHAGLPPLNAGVIAGFVIGSGTLSFVAAAVL